MARQGELWKRPVRKHLLRVYIADRDVAVGRSVCGGVAEIGPEHDRSTRSVGNKTSARIRQGGTANVLAARCSAQRRTIHRPAGIDTEGRRGYYVLRVDMTVAQRVRVEVLPGDDGPSGAIRDSDRNDGSRRRGQRGPPCRSVDDPRGRDVLGEDCGTRVGPSHDEPTRTIR